MPAQKRRAIGEADKQSIRQFSKDAIAGKRSIKEIQEWYKANTGHKLSPSTISEILSSRYNYLDTQTVKDSRDVKKHRSVEWPLLEIALFEWQQKMEARKIPITGTILQEGARHLWARIPQYRELEQPKFSNGWLCGFKKRFSIKQYRMHGEAGDVDLASANDMMEPIRCVANAFHKSDIYNMDESGLFWKSLPDKTLATRSTSGGKHDKARVTIVFTCNATGLDRLPCWIIGSAAKPLAFRAAGVHHEHMDFIYRYNGTKWMTTAIMLDYLRWFDRRMTGRSVLLLMDNFSAHDCAVRQLESLGADGLKNTKIQFLPPNTTSVHQPLDQGIIAAWKAYYRRRWLQFVWQESECERNPMKTMNLLRCVRWSISAWRIDMQPETIANCFRKAQIQSSDTTPLEHSIIQDSLSENIVAGIAQDIQAFDTIHAAMDIQNFINPPEEQVFDEHSDIFEHIAQQFDTEVEVDTEENVEVVEQVTEKEALESLSRLRLFSDQSGPLDSTMERSLERWEKELQAKKTAAKTQQSLHSYFN
jgi:hypothetical protein